MNIVIHRQAKNKEIGKAAQQNRLRLHNLALLLILPVFIDVINVIVNQFGLGSSSLVTAGVYVIFLLVVMMREKIRYWAVNDIAILCAVYGIFILNYFFFPDTREYIFTTEMIIIYIFILIPCVISFRKIRNFDGFFEIMHPYAIASVIVGGMMLMSLNYSKFLNYMDFSYAMLPSICTLYYLFRTGKNRILDLTLFVVGTIEIIVFGARAPILFIALFIAAFEILRADIRILTKIAVILLASIVVFLLNVMDEKIVNYLSTISIFRDSYFLQKLASGNLFAASTRDAITAACILRIEDMGLEVTGFFGDRAYCNSIYPHNIVLEVLMSWGWILGSLLIVALVIVVYRALKNRWNRDVTLLILISLVGRYAISGSYIIEGKFWLALTILLVLGRHKKRTDSLILESRV